MLVEACTQEGLGTLVVEAPAAIDGLVEPVPTWNLTTKVARVVLDGVAAERVGAMEAANDLAVEYAKVRLQFDRPIATFQVIKHKAADMLHRQERSRVGTHYAAWASEVDDDVRAEAAAMAKAYVPE